MQNVIGQFNDSFAPITDGVCNVVRNYAYWLQKKYGECYVIAPNFPGYDDNEEFDVLRYRSLPMPLRHPYRAGMAFSDLAFLKKLKGVEFDIIHAHSPFSSGRLGLRLARRLNIPIVATFHSKYYDDFKNALKSEAAAKLLLKYVIDFYRRVDCVWTVSNTAVDTLREYGYKGCVDVVSHGTDIDVMADKQDCSVNGNDGFKFLYVGQLVWHKNLRLLIFALRALKDAGMKFSITVVGEGINQQGIKKLIQKLGMSKNFKFTGRINDRVKLRNIYSQADLNLLPSVYDTFSLVVREAAAIGCPSLVMAGSCAAEGVEDGFNGYLSGNDISEYASCIEKAVADIEMLKTAGLNARSTLYRSWEDVVDEVAVRYSDIIDKNKKHLLH